MAQYYLHAFSYEAYHSGKTDFSSTNILLSIRPFEFEA